MCWHWIIFLGTHQLEMICSWKQVLINLIWLTHWALFGEEEMWHVTHHSIWGRRWLQRGRLPPAGRRHRKGALSRDVCPGSTSWALQPGSGGPLKEVNIMMSWEIFKKNNNNILLAVNASKFKVWRPYVKFSCTEWEENKSISIGWNLWTLKPSSQLL